MKQKHTHIPQSYNHNHGPQWVPCHEHHANPNSTILSPNSSLKATFYGLNNRISSA